MENYIASSHLNISSGAKKMAAKVWRTGSRKRPVSHPVDSSWNSKLLLSWVHLMVYADITFSPLEHKKKKALSAKQACLPGPGQHYHSSEIHIIQTVTFSPHHSLYHPGTLSTPLLIHAHFQGQSKYRHPLPTKRLLRECLSCFVDAAWEWWHSVSLSWSANMVSTSYPCLFKVQE